MADRKVMTRERIQYVYELAFFPPRIHQFWTDIKHGRVEMSDVEYLLRNALSLHLALPEKGFQSKRALKKIAACQASSKSFGTESFIKNIAAYVGADVNLGYSKIPAGMIRDFKLPVYSHK